MCHEGQPGFSAGRHSEKEGSFVHDGWWPLPRFVSYGIWILKGNWRDETWAGVSYLCSVKGSLLCFIPLGVLAFSSQVGPGWKILWPLRACSQDRLLNLVKLVGKTTHVSDRADMFDAVTFSVLKYRQLAVMLIQSDLHQFFLTQARNARINLTM